MQELSMNVLDVAENSVAAGAAFTEIVLEADTVGGWLTLTIADNGKGMTAETIAHVTDPFYTTRTTRKVGLGLPFLKMAAELTGGTLKIESAVGVGTTVTATFALGHIDLMPTGDMAGTVGALIQCNPDVDFCYRVCTDGDSFTCDTRTLRGLLDGVPFSEPSVALWVREYLAENTEPLLQKMNKEHRI